MLRRIMDAHAKLANGTVIFLLLSLFLLANFVIIPTIYPKFQTLDTLPSYTPQHAYELIASYGEQGRQYYAVTEGTLDLLYPLVMALMFSLLIHYTFRRAFPGKTRILYFALAPYAVLAADYLENLCIVIMLLRYPLQMRSIAQISNILTLTKFALTPLQLLFLIGLVGWLIQVIRSKRSGESTVSRA